MKILLAIGEGIEADAKDVAKFFDTLGEDVKNVFSPRGMLALAMLAAPVGEVIGATASVVAAGGLNIPLDVADAQLLVNLWPDLKAAINTLAVKPALTQPVAGKLAAPAIPGAL
jgi:hypothetical protein